MEKEVKELSEVQKIQQEFTACCSQLGDYYFKIALLEKAQFEISDRYRLAVEKEKKQKEEVETKNHFAEKANA